MAVKIAILLCLFLAILEGEAYVTRNSSPAPNVLESLQKSMEMFKNCLDQSLAKAVGDVNEKQLQPVFSVLGDQLNRFSKAFDDLTASSPKPTFEITL